MARFLESRSCNDDYVPFKVTRSTCEPNRLEQMSFYDNNINNITTYPHANIHFRQQLCFEEDPYLASIDLQLELISAAQEALWNNDGDNEDEERPPFHDDEEDPDLAAIDLRLELISAAQEALWNNDGHDNDDDLIRDEFYDDRIRIEDDDDDYEEFSMSDRYDYELTDDEQ